MKLMKTMCSNCAGRYNHSSGLCARVLDSKEHRQGTAPPQKVVRATAPPHSSSSSFAADNAERQGEARQRVNGCPGRWVSTQNNFSNSSTRREQETGDRIEPQKRAIRLMRAARGIMNCGPNAAVHETQQLQSEATGSAPSQGTENVRINCPMPAGRGMARAATAGS